MLALHVRHTVHAGVSAPKKVRSSRSMRLVSLAYAVRPRLYHEISSLPGVCSHYRRDVTPCGQILCKGSMRVGRTRSFSNFRRILPPRQI